MQELNVQTTLPALSFDATALKAWALSLTEKYIGLVVTEDAVTDVKRDMAELNKTRKAIDDARKEAVHQVSEPIRAFEKQIKEVCGIFDTAYQGLSEQVKVFEERERDTKRDVVRDIIAEALDARNLAVSAFPVPIQDKWLNKSTTLKSVREAVDDIISQHMQAERVQRQAEQAQQERAATIEQAVKAANARHGISLNVASFMVSRFMDLETPIEKVLVAIEEVAQNAEPVAKPAPAPVPVQSPQASPRQTHEPVSEKTMSIILTYPSANETAVRDALNQLRKACSSFNMRYR